MSAAHPLLHAMDEAIRLAEERRFLTAPNPCVGAVLVREGDVVAGGCHQGAGSPHAEIEALRDAAEKGIDPATCALVVTLEPCSHHGLTPPCTDAILAASIPHVVIGAMDPNPEASGGAEILRRNGVRVETGVARQECEDLISDFTTWQTGPYPYILLKLASTLDGRIATRTGHSRWITCEASRKRVHELRRRMDAVIVGGNTFHYDSPRLDYRLEDDSAPDDKQPLAVVVTSRLPDPGDSSFLLRERPTETIFWTTVAAAAGPKAKGLRERGVRVVGLPASPSSDGTARGPRAELDLAEGLRLLRAEAGCRYALCEGGGRLGLSLIREKLVGEFHLHLSPRILGDNEATPLFDGLSPLTMDEALPLRFVESHMCGRDFLLTLRPAASAECPAACPESGPGSGPEPDPESCPESRPQSRRKGGR